MNESWMDNFPRDLINNINLTEEQISDRLLTVDNNILSIQNRILNLFREFNVSESDLNGSTGYGYDDIGRDKLEKIYSKYFKTENALVRPQIVSGTHAISTALFGNLHSGDTLYYVTGMPYDTLQQVIGLVGNNPGSMLEYGIKFKYAKLINNGLIDYDVVKQDLMNDDSIKIVVIQRSRGYDTRNSFSVSYIKSIIQFIKKCRSDVIVFIDNCYGELVETVEPTFFGADLMAGSLCKNIGAGLVKTGGYIVGKNSLVMNAAARLLIPGVGKEEGATYGYLRDFYQGLFMAPLIVGEAIKGAIFSASLLSKYRINVSPKWDDFRTDIVQSLIFNDENKMIQFCKSIQHYSPINSFVDPIPAKMEGYKDKIIMASGSFTEGSTIELSSDGPLRSPYCLYMQGGLSYAHVKIAVSNAVRDIFYNN